MRYTHGRVKNHDPRNRDYAAAPRYTTMRSIRWDRNVPVQDQMGIGSCTGQGAIGALSCAPTWDRLSRVNRAAIAVNAHDVAVEVYSAATEIDPFPGEWPPDDTGSDLTSVAKVLRRRGLIESYRWCFNLGTVLASLNTGPVVIGVDWRSTMYEPTSDGQLLISGAPVGGHCVYLDEIDPDRERVWLTNSWGIGWGIEGRAWLTFSDLGALLADDGEAVTYRPAVTTCPLDRILRTL